jgi:hypothetical protein
VLHVAGAQAEQGVVIELRRDASRPPARPRNEVSAADDALRRSDLRLVGVEVRGFEPLASSVRVSSGSPLSGPAFSQFASNRQPRSSAFLGRAAAIDPSGTHRVAVELQEDGSRWSATAKVHLDLDRAELERLRWYLEDYPEYPIDPAPKIAAQVEQRLVELGQDLFGQVFQVREATRLWDRAEPGQDQRSADGRPSRDHRASLR